MKSGLFLFLYSILKAFLPLPSLEAVLLPICLVYPQYAFLYALLSGLGTCVGGHIGYELAYHYGRKIVLKWVREETLEEGIESFRKYGVFSVILGSLSPFPDFILAYVAGIMKMNRWVFMLLDGGCRFLRSLLLIAFSSKLNAYFPIDRYVMILSVLMLVSFFVKNALKKKR